MTLSEWINNIRWKYFTNNKSGLIFKELMKEFRMVEQMTENKRYNIKPSNIVEDAFYIKDDKREHSFPTVDDKSHLIMYEKALNEQDERINELELENAKHIGDGQWDIRDITYGHGKFRLEEWGERYHQFYDGDKSLEDEEVVSLLFENEKLKEDKEFWKQQAEQYSNELEVLKHELLCKQLDKAPKEPVNCKCYYGDVE